MVRVITLTLEIIDAEAEAALAIDRAAGAPIPKDGMVEEIYFLGFAAGAAWALAELQEQTK